MIQITNISTNRFAMSTVSRGERGVPIAVELPPRFKHPNWVQFPNEYLHNWPLGAKTQLADGVSAGLVRVDVVLNIHDAHDRRTVPLMEGTSTNLTAMITAATFFKTFFNEHVGGTAWHTAPGVTMVTAADPTGWPTIYVIIADEQAMYAAHLGDAIHPNLDTINVLTLPPPGTPEQAVAALNELYSLFSAHKIFALPPVAPALSPAAIIAY